MQLSKKKKMNFNIILKITCFSAYIISSIKTHMKRIQIKFIIHSHRLLKALIFFFTSPSFSWSIFDMYVQSSSVDVRMNIYFKELSYNSNTAFIQIDFYIPFNWIKYTFFIYANVLRFYFTLLCASVHCH